MKLTSEEKGKALERAVAAIESAILARNPELRGHEFVIENRKTVVVNGVKHEIDILVTIPRGDGYDAVFIFECKNTVENIGKNEILLFAEKIKATSATRGFFVAKGFGEYARAQAGQFPRIVLLHASENVLSTGAFKNFGMVGTINPNLRFTLRERNGSGVVKPTEASVATYNKKKYPFSEFIERTIERLTEKRVEKADVKTLPPGTYTLRWEGEMGFRIGALLVDGREIEKMTFKLRVGYRYVCPKIRVCFEVTGRGQYVEFDDIEVGSGYSLRNIAVTLPAKDES